MLQTHEQHGKTKLVTTIVAVLVVAGVVLLVDHIKAASGSASNEQTQSVSTTQKSGSGSSASSSVSGSTSSGSTSSSSGTKDGSYSASSEYSVPHSNENIQVSVTLQSGTITDVSIQNSDNDPTSAVFQEDFASAYKSAVIGKKISGLSLSTIAGASDTTQAFDDALSQIANKAQA